MLRYVDWRERSAAVDQAYGSWSNGRRAEGAVRFAAYMEELEREESAAALYGAVIDRLERRFGREAELVFSGSAGR